MMHRHAMTREPEEAKSHRRSSPHEKARAIIRSEQKTVGALLLPTLNERNVVKPQKISHRKAYGASGPSLIPHLLAL